MWQNFSCTQPLMLSPPPSHHWFMANLCCTPSNACGIPVNHNRHPQATSLNDPRTLKLRLLAYQALFIQSHIGSSSDSGLLITAGLHLPPDAFCCCDFRLGDQWTFCEIGPSLCKHIYLLLFLCPSQLLLVMMGLCMQLEWYSSAIIYCLQSKLLFGGPICLFTHLVHLQTTCWSQQVSVFSMAVHRMSLDATG